MKTKYKILIKYISTFKKDFYEFYQVQTEDSDELIDFETDDVEVLKTTLNILDKKYGYENLRIIVDVTYTISVGVDEIKQNDIEIVDDVDLQNIYATAYKNVFGEDSK